MISNPIQDYPRLMQANLSARLRDLTRAEKDITTCLDGQHFLDQSIANFRLVHSTLASDPDSGFRKAATQILVDYWLNMPDSESAYRSFLSLPRKQRLSHIRQGDPRLLEGVNLDLNLARFNQLSTILRAVQTLANLPRANKHVAGFFEHLKQSGIIENLDQSNATHSDYRQFIENEFCFPNRPVLPTEVPTALVKLCITGIRRAAVIKAVSTGDFSIVGNQDLLGKFEHKELCQLLRVNSVIGIRFTVISILKRFSPDQTAISALSYLHKSLDFDLKGR